MKKSTDIKIKSRWLEIMQPFSLAVKGEVLAAVCIYVSNGQIPELSEAAAVAFAFIRYEIDEASSRKAAAAARRRERIAQKSIPPEVEQPIQNKLTSEKPLVVEMPRPDRLQSQTQKTRSRLPRKLKKRLKARAIREAALNRIT